MMKRYAALLLPILLLPATARAGEQTASIDPAPVLVQHGTASYYGRELQGRPTATGEIFNENALTAASRTLPLGSKATVLNERNGRSVTVRINDRGPYIDGRIVDLSKAAARKLHMERQGLAPVRVQEKPAAQPTPELRKVVAQKAKKQAETREAEVQERRFPEVDPQASTVRPKS